MPLINLKFHFKQNRTAKTHQQQQQPTHEEEEQEEQQQEEHQEQAEHEEHHHQGQQQKHLTSPTPLPPELTIAVLHPSNSPDQGQAILQAKIESRIASTGFKVIDQIAVSFTDTSQINALNLSTNSASGLAVGSNLIYLLSRSRAIQVWKDLVGIEPTLPDLPARPGSLKFMLGPKVIWAADRLESVYQLIHTFWPDSTHLQNPQFNQLLKSFHSPSSTTSPHPESLSIQSHSSQPRPRRVFKFSHPIRDDVAASSPSTPQVHSDCSGSDSNQPAKPHSPSAIPSPTTTRKHHSRIPQSKNSPGPSVFTRSSDFGQSFNPTSTSFVNKNKTSLLPSPHLISKSSSSSISSPSSSANDLDSSPQKSHVSPPASTHFSDTTSLPNLSNQSSPPIKTESTSAMSSNGPTPFRARPVPATTAEAMISPRMSKTAMLRLGLAWTPPPPRGLNSSQSSNPSSNPTPTKTSTASAPSVASLNPPVVQPRQTKASKLRSSNGGMIQEGDNQADKRSLPPKKTESEIFENTPGHGYRRANLVTHIPSIAPLKNEPRPTKASALRASAMDSLPTQPIASPATNSTAGSKITAKANSRLSVDYFLGVPGHKRSEKFTVEATKKPSIEPRMTKASLLRMNNGSSSTCTGNNNNKTSHAKNGIIPKRKNTTSSNVMAITENEQTQNDDLDLQSLDIDDDDHHHQNDQGQHVADVELVQSVVIDPPPQVDSSAHIPSPLSEENISKICEPATSSRREFGSVVILPKTRSSSFLFS